MTSYVYDIVEELYCCDDSRRISYGIVCYENPEINGMAVVIASVHDVTSDHDSLRQLVDLCNKLSLSPLHLQDAVEDFLG